MFFGCSELTTVRLGKGIEEIGDEGFGRCKKLMDFYCFAEKIPTARFGIGTFAESNINRRPTTLHVPANLVEEYRSTFPWSDYHDVIALTDEDTAIKPVSFEEDVPFERYSLGGTPIRAEFRGLNILKLSNGKTKKVLAK